MSNENVDISYGYLARDKRTKEIDFETRYPLFFKPDDDHPLALIEEFEYVRVKITTELALEE